MRDNRWPMAKDQASSLKGPPGRGRCIDPLPTFLLDASDARHPPSGFFRRGILRGMPAMNPLISRREALWRLGGGLGGIALAHLLGQGGLLADTQRPRPRPELAGGLHHPARVRRIVQIFLNGGVSQVDTFDYKPELEKRHGQAFDPGEHVEAATSAPGNLMKSPFPFR